ncbi:MAG: competence/damage-inducible protein A [Pseudomonadota bacterium]
MTSESQAERIWRAGMVVIGDEILSGRTQDANVSYLARWLNTRGVKLAEVRIVADDYDAIGEALLALKDRNDYVFTTGGIGPTHDDITVDAISRALGVDTIFHPEAVDILRRYYGDDKMNDRRKLMARVPDGADILVGQNLGAPAIRKDNIFILAGIPSIMQAMLDAMGDLIEGGQPVISRTVAAMTPESEAADVLDKLQNDYPDASIGSYPLMRDGKIGANFVVRSADAQRVDQICAALMSGLSEAGIQPIDGEI